MRRNRRTGQVVVEMILILPVFLGIVFTIMEIGNVSFRLIVLNHATYEVARIGGMTYAAAERLQRVGRSAVMRVDPAERDGRGASRSRRAVA